MLEMSRNLSLYTTFAFLWIALFVNSSFFAGLVLCLIASAIMSFYWKRHIDRLRDKKSFLLSSISNLIITMNEIKLEGVNDDYVSEKEQSVQQENEVLLSETFHLFDAIKSLQVNYFEWKPQNVEEKLVHYYSYIEFYTNKIQDLLNSLSMVGHDIDAIQYKLDEIKGKIA